LKAVVLLMIAAAAYGSVDPHCPRYPESAYVQAQEQLSLEREAGAFAKRSGKQTARRTVASANFIDDFIFNKMSADGVASAPLSTDQEFLRRISLDLTGRIPSVERVQSFLTDKSEGRRAALIDELMRSDPFTDYFTYYLANRMEVTSGYYAEIPIQARNLFYFWLRDGVRNDRPYYEMVTEMLTGKGLSSRSGPMNFLVRGWQDGDPIQDTWDTLTDRVTTKFLGLKTECVSCHDGRRHLEQINLYMASRKRADFWGMSAFFSRMNLQRIGTDTFNQGIIWNVTDRNTGGYYTQVSQTNPGPRPARSGGVWEPKYMYSGEEPQSADWRGDFARILVKDRQFARATVNYLWAHFFRRGIVDPADAWDLARVDPDNPPPAGWPMQSSHPQLLEALTDSYIQSGYKLRPIVQLIVSSNAYQLSSRYDGNWKSAYAWYFAKQTPRRLSAEEVYDAVITATQTEGPMFITGFPSPVYYAVQLPDPTEPRGDGNIRNFLTQFGRGDWWTIPRKSSPSLLQVLYLMNDSMNVNRTLPTGTYGANTRLARLAQAPISEAEAITQMYLATLSRYPTDDETAKLTSLRKGVRDQWLSDVQWALLNKLDFIFNY